MRVLGGNQEGESSHCWSLLPPRLEVSSAVLVAGVNMPDHDVLFERLRSKIHAEASPYLVSLRAKDCNSGSYILTKQHSVSVLFSCIRNEGYNAENLHSVD